MLRFSGFTAPQTAALRSSIVLIKQKLRKPPGPMPHDLRAELDGILSQAHPEVQVYFDGSRSSREMCAHSGGYCVWLCPKAFQAKRPKGKPRLPAVLFHELIHIAFGWELDAEAFENAWFDGEEGARPPDREDWANFKEDEYQGWWVRLDSRTRRVTDYADRFIVTFPALSRQGSGTSQAHPSERKARRRRISRP